MTGGDLLIVIIVVVALLYARDRYVYYLAKCWRCGGSGLLKSRLPLSNGERPCPRCQGQRKRKRFGSPNHG